MSGSKVKKKADEGEYTLINPLDYMLLDFIPEEGQLSFGLYPLGENVVNLRKKFSPEQQKALTTTAITGRLTTMRAQGLVKPTHSGSSNKHIWQRTKRGTDVVNKWKGANGGGASATDGGKDNGAH